MACNLRDIQTLSEAFSKVRSKSHIIKMLEIPKGGVFLCNTLFLCSEATGIISHVNSYRTRENNTNLYPVTSKDPENIILKTKKEARASRIPLPTTSTTELNQKEKPIQL